MYVKVVFFRISGYINHTLGFLLGPSKCLYIFSFCANSFFCADAFPLGHTSAQGPLPYLNLIAVC